MNNYQQFFDYEEVQLYHFYIYFVLAAAIAFYLTLKSNSRNKIELFFLSFYLLTGNINDLLTIKIPGFSLFEIQPERFLFFLLFFFIVRKLMFSKEKIYLTFNMKVPWFEVALYAYMVLLVISVLVNGSVIGIADVLKTILDTSAFLVLIMAFRLMADRPSYDLIGKSIITGAVASSIISLVQFSIDPYFLRIGDARLAFGSVIRSNGLFGTEYFNSYYLIIAIAWTLITFKNNLLKFSLVTLFTLGIISSFQRMSWLILVLILFTYFVYIKKVAIEKLLLAGLSLLALLTFVTIFFYQDIMNSTLIKERLSEQVDSRQGYYTMVLNNIGKKPVFGYGGLKNEVYYENMMRITRSRARATAKEGDLHSGYFSTLFLNGIPAFICFTLFAILPVFYYSRSFKDDLYFVIPFFVSIIFMIGNLTNTLLFQKYISILYAIHIGIGMGIHKLNKRLSS